MSALLRSALPACALLAGCYSTHLMPPSELMQLAGFDGRGPAPQLTDSTGAAVAYEPSSRLWLHLRQGGRRGGRFERIEIQRDLLYGHLPGGSEMIVALPEVRYVRIDTYSPGRTAALVVGLTLGAAAVAVGIAVPLTIR